MKQLNHLKKQLIVILLLIGIALPSAAVSGYRGFASIEGGPCFSDGITYGSIGASTTHGYQCSNHFFVGGGIGVFYSLSVEEDGYSLDFPLHIPIYAQIRYDYSLLSPHSFYAAFGVGYDIGNSYYAAPEFGVRFGKNSPISFNLGLKFNLSTEYWDDWNYGEYDDIRFTPSVILGIEF